MTTTETLIEDVPGPAPALSGDEAGEIEPAPPVPASLSRRFGNFVLDGIVLGVVEMTLDGITRALDLQLQFEAELLVVVLALTVCYTVPEWLFGRTLGK